VPTVPDVLAPAPCGSWWCGGHCSNPFTTAAVPGVPCPQQLSQRLWSPGPHWFGGNHPGTLGL